MLAAEENSAFVYSSSLSSVNLKQPKKPTIMPIYMRGSTAIFHSYRNDHSLFIWTTLVTINI